MRSPLASAVCLALVLASGAAFAQVDAAPADLNDDMIAKLEAGEIIIDAQRGDPNRGESLGIVDGPIDQVVSIILDYENFIEWYPGQLDPRLIEADMETGTGRAYGEVAMPWPIPNRTYEVDVTGGEGTADDGAAVRWLQWVYVEDSGNLEQLYGFWYLRSWGEGRTLVRYVVYADMGTWVPDAVINWATRRMLPGILEGLRGRYDELF